MHICFNIDHIISYICNNVTIESLSNENVDVVVQRASHLLNSLDSRLPAIDDCTAIFTGIQNFLQEHRTASIVAQHLRDTGYDVTEGVGQTGVVGLFRNGAGPVVMLRADMDALPIKEQTGVDYASDVFKTAIR
jgi:hypothetical protein